MKLKDNSSNYKIEKYLTNLYHMKIKKENLTIVYNFFFKLNKII